METDDIPDGSDEFNEEGSLPEELQGVDINQDDLPRIEGEDKTAMQRVIICYKEEEEPKLLGMLGLKKLDKVVYLIDELPNAK